jgi:plasmid stabilization system protein ParE
MGIVVRRPKAKADLKAIHAWIARDSIGAASAYIRKINAAILRVSDNPLSAPRRLERFPNVSIARVESHILLYRPLDAAKGIELLRIVHGAQDWLEHPEIH